MANYCIITIIMFQNQKIKKVAGKPKPAEGMIMSMIYFRSLSIAKKVSLAAREKEVLFSIENGKIFTYSHIKIDNYRYISCKVQVGECDGLTNCGFILPGDSVKYLCSLKSDLEIEFNTNLNCVTLDCLTARLETDTYSIDYLDKSEKVGSFTLSDLELKTYLQILQMPKINSVLTTMAIDFGKQEISFYGGAYGIVEKIEKMYSVNRNTERIGMPGGILQFLELFRGEISVYKREYHYYLTDGIFLIQFDGGMSSPDMDKFKSDYSDIIHVKDFNVIKDLSPASKLVDLFILKNENEKRFSIYAAGSLYAKSKKDDINHDINLLRNESVAANIPLRFGLNSQYMINMLKIMKLNNITEIEYRNPKSPISCENDKIYLLVCPFNIPE